MTTTSIEFGWATVFKTISQPRRALEIRTKVPVAVAPKIRSNVLADVVVSNNHFADLENNNVDLSAVLMKVIGQKIADNDDPAQAVMTNNPDPAGVLTSRSFLTSHVIAGTNRRPIQFTFREFMCVDIADWSDTGAPDLRIGPDIDRYPGGDHSQFEKSCKGCHTQMDSFRGALAYWDASANRGAYSPGKVVSKYTRNSNMFPDGYVPKDDSFINNSNRAANAAAFGWRGSNVSYGNGFNQFGTLVSNSRRFSECMSKRVFEASCKQSFDLKTNLPMLQKFATQFEANGYNFKKLFRIVATSPECLGE